ncbi:hypothetical protein [Mesorhizobium sp. 1B3]|uniref:hypothetical protein n=1 Tax=Mesorhizobium sp. 1B3 TaxID=3243599 RepID=UPI003D96D37C
MGTHLNHRRFLLGLGFSGFILAVAGCQASDTTAKISDVNGGQLQPPPAKIQESELRAYCPAVTLRDGTAVLRTYAKGGQDDPQKLAYQASISDVTRSCARSDTQMTINVAAAGRVVTGPAGAAGAVTLPIRIVVVRGEEVLYSQLHKHQVNITNPSAATQYVFNDPNVVIPLPEPGTIQVFVGYDEGPPSKQR